MPREAGSCSSCQTLGVMEYLRPLLSGLIGVVITGLLLRWVSRESEEALPPGAVRYGRRMKSISLFMLAIGSFIAYAALNASPDQRGTAFLVATPLVLSSVWFVLEVFLVSAEVTNETLIHTSPWRGTRKIPWSAIIGYSYSSAMSWHVLETEGYGTVRLSVYMSSVDQVAEQLALQSSYDA